jgi:hypothetical protein
MKTISSEQFKKTYGDAGADLTPTIPPSKSFLENVKTDLAQRGENVFKQSERNQSVGSDVLQFLGQGAGFVGDIATEGIKKVGEVTGGFAMEKENIHFLEDKLNIAGEKIFTHHDGSELIRESVDHDVVISVSDITRDLHTALTALSPFGLGNRSPIFLLSQVTPISISSFGKGKEHLEITFQNGYGTVRAIQFFTKPERYKLDPENPTVINVYGHVEYSVFMGKGELRMRILDIQPPK